MGNVRMFINHPPLTFHCLRKTISVFCNYMFNGNLYNANITLFPKKNIYYKKIIINYITIGHTQKK